MLVVPTLVRGELQNKAVVQVAAGAFHSMCVAEDGSVCTWGCNDHGQQGVPSVTDDVHLPVLLQVLDVPQ